MRPIDLSKLRPFYMVAREGSMTKAAAKLNVSQPSLSVLIGDLEYNLKTQLFERLPAGVRLTAHGEELYAFAETILQQTDSFEKKFHEKEDEISGDLKIVTTPFTGTNWLVPALKDFLKKHPAIKIKILLRSENFSPSDGDVVISALIPHQPHLIQKPLFSVNIRLFASSEYLRIFGIPQRVEDLNQHRLITYKGNYYTAYGSTNWVLNVGIKAGQAPRTSYFEIDSLQGMFISAQMGYGIAELPDLFITPECGLIEIIPTLVGPTVDLYYIFPENRRNSKKIDKLFQYLLKRGRPKY
jgi:DNA-binding transcriptional LysR family regulator